MVGADVHVVPVIVELAVVKAALQRVIDKHLRSRRILDDFDGGKIVSIGCWEVRRADPIQVVKGHSVV